MKKAAPAALAAAAFALWSYWPASGGFPGTGADAYFNLWHFEVLWRNLSSGAPLFWAPLYGGTPLGLTYSETQLAPALLLWPVRSLCGNGALTLGIAAVALSLAAYACTLGWLRALGLRELAPWGALLFAGCGWLQTQYAHFQNLCIFLLPLAFWAWERFARAPSPVRLALCALAFAWMGAWNIYFAIFADACLVVWALRARRPAVLLLAFALQVPVAWPYLRLSTAGALTTYGANWRSVLGSGDRPRLLEPSFNVSVEEAGYLGVIWLALLVWSLRRRESRPWALACALAFWISLGRGYGLFDGLAVLPGVSSLRAIGRAQLMVFLFSLPAVLGFLEAKRMRWPLALVMLELLPASRPARVTAPPAAPVALPADQAVLVWPLPDARVMLQLAPSRVPYFGGYSGRAPPGEELLGTLSLDDARLLTRARRVMETASWKVSEVAPADAPALRLDRDAQMQAVAAPWPAAELRALRDGVLEIRSLDSCHMRQTAVGFARDLPLEGLGRVRVQRGDVILRVGAKQWIYRALHVPVKFAVICDQA